MAGVVIPDLVNFRKKSKRLLFFLLFEIFQRNKQHSEALTVFFAEMLVMHFVGASDGSEIPVVAVAEDFKSLVNEDIVHHEVAKPVNSNSDTDIQFDITSGKYTKEHQ